MVSAVNGSRIVSDSTLLIRDLIASGVTDPISRTGNQRFVLTSYPERDVRYPIITVLGKSLSESQGWHTEAQALELGFEVRTWGRTQEEMDKVSDSVYDALRTSQQGTSPVSGTETYNLFNFRKVSDVPVIEEGKGGIHSKVQTYQYNFFV